MNLFSDISSGIFVGVCSGNCLTFFLAYRPTFFLSYLPTYFLTYFLAYLLAFFLASLLTLFLTFFLANLQTLSLAYLRGRGPAANTERKCSRLGGRQHWQRWLIIDKSKEKEDQDEGGEAKEEEMNYDEI